jgi:DNA-binding response OmpR family regulator
MMSLCFTEYFTSLRSSGFAVEEVRTAEEALAVMRERTFDLALLYINAPGANGVDLCRQMRTLGESIGMVMVRAQDAARKGSWTLRN